MDWERNVLDLTRCNCSIKKIMNIEKIKSVLQSELASKIW